MSSLASMVTSTPTSPFSRSSRPSLWNTPPLSRASRLASPTTTNASGTEPFFPSPSTLCSSAPVSFPLLAHRNECVADFSVPSPSSLGVNMATYYAGTIFLQSIRLAPAKASLALGGLGVAGFVFCAASCFLLIEKCKCRHSATFEIHQTLGFASNETLIHSRSCSHPHARLVHSGRRNGPPRRKYRPH